MWRTLAGVVGDLRECALFRVASVPVPTFASTSHPVGVCLIGPVAGNNCTTNRPAAPGHAFEMVNIHVVQTILTVSGRGTDTIGHM